MTIHLHKPFSIHVRRAGDKGPPRDVPGNRRNGRAVCRLHVFGCFSSGEQDGGPERGDGNPLRLRTLLTFGRGRPIIRHNRAGYFFSGRWAILYHFFPDSEGFCPVQPAGNRGRPEGSGRGSACSGLGKVGGNAKKGPITSLSNATSGITTRKNCPPESFPSAGALLLPAFGGA